ncbi:dnaJ homolog subfamily C member 11-like isoform X2 [Montipora capricornis]|uniref:dnaJ homolog subfamily C member 11-like isoform X2 n=1 Tax=Montipora capricornis TaxID=246305 RepID=UPI0035F13E0B
MAESEDQEEIVDYYAILNVRREANENEIKAAYRRMCMLYHPDKHRDPAKKKIAEELFSKIQKAYEVLSIPESRGIYDIYGQKGLNAGWEVIERQRTPAEIREEYERLKREREERRLQELTNPAGSISVEVDATDLFDTYDEDFDRGPLPSIEVRSMTISQSIEAPLTTMDTLTLRGSVNIKNGNGSGTVSVSARRVLSHRAWGSITFEAGEGPKLTFRAFANVTQRSYCSGGIALGSHENGLSAGANGMLARQLDRHTVGYITYQGGLQSAMNTTVIRETETSRAALTVHLSFSNSFLMASYTRKIEKNTKLKATVKTGTFGSLIAYGCERQISDHSHLAATVRIGIPDGVCLKIKLTRANQVYNFPITLSEDIQPAAIFYGTLVPVVVFWVVKALVVNPFLKMEKDRESEAKREKFTKQMAEKKREAENSIRLMQETCERIVEYESSRHGLVIVNAWYGHLVTMEESSNEAHRRPTKVIDVTVPVQCQVKDSRLFLTESSKSNLSGFYDPCPEEEKMLRVRYLFREAIHEVTVGDEEPVKIPKQSHKIQAS